VKSRSMLFILIFVALFGLAACAQSTPAGPAVSLNTPAPAASPTKAPAAATVAPSAVPSGAPSAVPSAAPSAVATQPSAATPIAPTAPAAATAQLPKGALTCPPIVPLPASAQLAARVNGVGVALDLYNRQIAQAQDAMIKNFGTDPNSAAGQETLKSLKQQVLDQLINDVVITQYSDSRNIKVSTDELNARLAQMIQDAGSVDKLNEYMTRNQLTLADLCLLVRNQLLGEAALNDVTAPIPTKGEQAHVFHIMLDTPALAQTIRDRARKGENFSTLAKQYSKDETTKTNGGDMGWVPRGVLDPQLEAVIFEIGLNQVSDVITTQFGYHLVLVTEKDKARALPPEVIQNVRQDAFLKWLRAMRENTKIERFVQP